MSVHKLKDGRWFVKYPKGTIKKDPNRTREYFGRGEEAKVLAYKRNRELGFQNPKTDLIEGKFKEEINKLEREVSLFKKGVEHEVQKELTFLLRLANRDDETVQEQVYTNTGYIDILTPREIIEIKVLQEWKYGVGQLLTYQQAFPNRKLRLHLFERPIIKQRRRASKKTIKGICDSLQKSNILVSFQDRETYLSTRKQFKNVVPLFSCSRQG